MTATLVDTHDRVVFAQAQPVTQEATTLTFVAAPPILYNMGYTWRFALRSGTRLWDTAKADLVVIPPREFKRFTFTSWGAMFLWKCEYLWEDLSGRVEDLGLDVAMNGGNELESGTVWRDYWHNVNHSYLGILEYMGKDVPDFRDAKFAENAAAYAKTKDKKYLVREPSLQDPEYLRKMADALRTTKWAPIAQFGRAYDYCMGDEMSLTYYTQYLDYDFSPPSLAALRKWLQGRYKSLDELNAIWETQFADWDSVMPMTLDEVKARPNAAPWGEFRTFMNETMANYCSLIQRTIREKDPEARCGLSGTQEPKPGNGMDWWLMSQGFSYYHSYNTGWSDEMRRSFQPYTVVAASPYRSGYFQAGAGLEYQVFWCLLHDTKGISAWMTPLFFNSDFSLSESGADQRKLIHEMKAGVWDAIRSAQRQHDGIAIHYSQASINGALLMSKDEQITKVRDAWVNLIEDLGLQYNFVSYAQVESGILTRPKNDSERYKVLILPESIALSAREVAEIKQFVQSGGTVIGDQCIGLMDDRCRKAPKGMLDDVFGIARSGEDKPLSLGVSVTGLKDQIRLPIAEAGVRAAGAQARGKVADADVPALLTNAFGRGRAAYLNLNLTEFQNERTFATPTERALRQAMLDILAASGVRPRYPITLQSGKVPHVETIRHAAGPLEYLGLMCQGNGKDDIATVSLGAERYAYDARTGKSLGRLGKLTVPVSAAGDCRVYCLSSAPLGKVAATVVVGRGLVPRPQAPEDAPSLRYKLSLAPGSAGERQIVRLAVIRPDGTEEGDYARNVVLGDAPLEGAVQLAVDDPAGKWTVRARALCTGQVATATAQVGK